MPLAISPDGSVLAEIGNMGNLAVRILETGETRQLTNSQFPQGTSAAAFSPDGRQIGYSWQNERGYVDLRVVDVTGSEPRVLYGDGDVRYMAPKAWSPDGTHLLIVVLRADSSGGAALVSVSDGSLRELPIRDVQPRLHVVSSPVWGESPKTMAFSPDGRFIAYDESVRGNDPNYDIHILAVDGSSRHTVVEHPADNRLLGWARDGRSIVFASDRAGAVGLWTLAVHEGRPQGVPETLNTTRPIGVYAGRFVLLRRPPRAGCRICD